MITLGLSTIPWPRRISVPAGHMRTVYNLRLKLEYMRAIAPDVWPKPEEVGAEGNMGCEELTRRINSLPMMLFVPIWDRLLIA